MTPKEKAKELVNKFREKLESRNVESPFEPAKQCALIAVEEILNEVNGDGFSWNINCYWNGEKYVPCKEWKEFWQQVKNEITKL